MGYNRCGVFCGFILSVLIVEFRLSATTLLVGSPLLRSVVCRWIIYWLGINSHLYTPTCGCNLLLLAVIGETKRELVIKENTVSEDEEPE